MSQQESAQRPSTPAIEIAAIAIDSKISLRTMVVRHPSSRNTVLLLHGFPETIFAFQDLALALGEEHAVHAFDWPGYGLSSRPAVEQFSYSPHDYARILDAYIEQAGIDRATLTIYAPDIGGLPVLLAALDRPDIARSIVVGDFAPFNRPALMWDNLQALKARPAADHVRDHMNANREEIIANTYWRGLPEAQHYRVSDAFRNDVAHGWSYGSMTSVDAFYHYYSHFTEAQEYFEANLDRLKTPLQIIWGAEDLYINFAMGVELAERTGAPLSLLEGVGHYAHLQAPDRLIDTIRQSFI